MVQTLQLKIVGLNTSSNELSAVPEGTLIQADNVDIISSSIAQPRRGFGREVAGYTDAADRTDRLFFYQDRQFAHHGTLASADTLSYLSGTWQAVSGTYTAPTDYKIRTLEAAQNLFLTTGSGVYKLDAYNGTPRLSGAYKALDVSASVSASAATWLLDDFRVAYRVIWGYRDANNNLILGAPSQRESFKNTAGSTKAVDLRVTIPSGVTTSWFVQVYRTAAIDNTAADTEPNDEMGLVYETNPTSGDITSGYIDITDIVPDALRGATIYTAASQEGLVNQNERPPLARDIAAFRDSVFYANTTSKHRYTLTLLSVGGTNGIAADDTITIGGVVYTGKATETIASAQFKVETSGSLSASQQIRDTALSLIRVINRHTSSTVYAFYLSGPDDLPGKILIEERGIGGSSFPVLSSRATCWNPALPTSGTTQSSTNDRYKNGLFWSKPNQPEAVPLPNFATVGDKDREILRIIPLKDALLIFKEEGIYRLTGYYPDFNIDLLDSSATLIGTETPAILNNQVLCLTNQGVVSVGDSVSVISLPIEDGIKERLAENLAGISSSAFGIGYETERKYYIFLPDNSGEDYPTLALVYNAFTRAWTNHLLSATCGAVNPSDGNFYLGDTASNYVLKERKAFNYSDFADYGFETTIAAVADEVVTLGSGIDSLEVGDIIWQSSTLFATVQSIDYPTFQATISTNPGLSVASATVLKAIPVVLKWAPITGGNVGILKHFHTAEIFMKNDFAGVGYLGFETELSQAVEYVPIAGLGTALWGLFPWGEEPWGGFPLRRPVRQWLPREKQRGSQHVITFTHSVAYSDWKLQGISLFGQPGSERTSR